MKKSIRLFIALLFLLISHFELLSQKNEKPILVAIEDSLRGKLVFPYDSLGLTQHLELQQSVMNNKNIAYKLVKVGKRDFTEGPQAERINKMDSNKRKAVKFGDSTYYILGKKTYTYIGNSSWGFQNEYQFEKVFPISKSILIPKTKGIETCKHGWDMQRGQACTYCLDEYRQKYDTTYDKFIHKNIDSHSKNYPDEIKKSYCKHEQTCCEIDCEFCPTLSKRKRRKIKRARKRMYRKSKN